MLSTDGCLSQVLAVLESSELYLNTCRQRDRCEAEVEVVSPSLFDHDSVGLNMMLVIVSGCHSSRPCTFQLSLRE